MPRREAVDPSVTQHISTAARRPSALWLLAVPLAMLVGGALAVASDDDGGAGETAAVEPLEMRRAGPAIPRLGAVRVEPLPRPRLPEEPDVEPSAPAPAPSSVAPTVPSYSAPPAPSSPPDSSPPSDGRGGGGGEGVTIIREPR